MNTKHPHQSKTILGVLISVIGALATKYNIEVLPGEAQAISESVLILGGALLAVYGRIKAKDKIQLGSNSIPMLLIPFLLVSVALQLGCNTPEIRSSIKDTVKVASQVGLIKLLQGTKEAQPYLASLVRAVDVAFNASDDPTEIGSQIAGDLTLAVTDYATQQLLLDLMVEELTKPPVDDGVTAGPPGKRAFDSELATALRQRAERLRRRASY